MYYPSITVLLQSVISVSDTLHLFDVNPIDNGGEYICGVINDAGTGLSHSYLNFPPEITKDPDNQLVEVFDEASFSCEAQGFPYPSYQWQLHQQTINTFSDIIDQTDTEYNISSVNFPLAGNRYRCKASNLINDTVRDANSDTATLYGNR